MSKKVVMTESEYRDWARKNNYKLMVRPGNFVVVPDGSAKTQYGKKEEDTRKKEEQALRKLMKAQPAYESLLKSSAAQDLQKSAYGTDPLAEFQAQRAQAQAAAEQGKLKIGQQLHDELQDQSIAQAGQTANAYSQLAMGGGLSSGARERVASGGLESNLYAAQAARLDNQRALQEQQSTLDQGLLGITAKEGETRRGLQNSYLDLQKQDTAGINSYKQDQWAKRADLESGILKSRSEERIAKNNQR